MRLRGPGTLSPDRQGRQGAHRGTAAAPARLGKRRAPSAGSWRPRAPVRFQTLPSCSINAKSSFLICTVLRAASSQQPKLDAPGPALDSNLINLAA